MQMQRRKFVSVEIFLFAKQIAVRPGAGQRQNKYIVFYSIDEKPVRENVTFPVTNPIAGQIVVVVFLWKRLSYRQPCNDLLQQFDFQTAFDCPFLVLFKSGCIFDGIFCFLHFLRSANNSSRSL